ncbi:unnamed protein product [Closterium sp. NIES-53]
MHNGASRANRLRASVSVRTTVFYRATLDSRSDAALAHRRPAVLARSPFCSAGTSPLCNAGRRSTMLCCRSTRLSAELLAAIVTMVDPVTNAGVADTLEARLADARKHHTDGEHGTIPLLIVELGIRLQWATEHPSRPDSPRLVRNEGRRWRRQESGASAAVDGDCRQLASQRRWSTSLSSMKRWWALGDDACVSGRDCTDVGYFKFSPDRITVALLQGRRDLITWMESIEPQLDVAGLKGFADGTVPIPPVDDVGLRGEFRAAHFLTFMVISRCCSPVVQLALRSCQERLDAGHQAWHFILSTYQVRDDLYIAQLEENMTHILMDEQESATDYCNRARRILAEMRMAGAEYSTASYISHIVKGLPRGYNLMKRMMMVPGTHESLDEDSIASYILQDEAMQEAKQPTELLPQANYTTSTKLNQQQGQRRKPGGGGRGSGRSTKDVDEKRSTRDKGRGGAVRRRECWICHDPNHLSYECPDRDDSDEDDTKGAVAAAVQANPMAVLLDSGCSHHLMGTKAVFVDMVPSDGVKHVRGFNGALQPAHAVAIGLDTTSSTRADPPCVSCVRGKLAQHTFPDKGSDAEVALAVVHIDLCGPFRVAAKDGSLYFLLLKDRHTRFVWVMLVAKKSDVLWEFQKKEFTDFIDGKGIVHDLTCPYTPQQNGMAEWEMRIADDAAARGLAAPLVAPRPTTSCVGAQLLGAVDDATGDDSVQAADWEEARPHAGAESKGWEVLDLTDNKVVTSVEVIFYETMSLEVWKAKLGPVSGRTQAHPPTDTSTTMVPLLAEVDEPADEDVVAVLPPSPVLAAPFPVADRPASTPVSATGDEGSLEASPVAPASDIAGGRQGAKLVDQDGTPSTTGEQQTGEPVEQEAAAGVQPIGELPKSAGGEQLVDDLAVDEEGELSAGEESTVSDMVEVPITKPELRLTGRARWPPERLSFHACLPPAAFSTVYDEVDDDLFLVSMGTWELVERPRAVNIMKNRWVLTTKYRLDDTVERKKARLVVKGFIQVCGADYDETYSPVRIFLSIVAVFDLNLMQLDMKNAFLQSKLDRVLYMYQPDYFDDGTGQAAFELREISPAVKYLGLEIVHDKPARKLWLHQQGYADKLRRHFIDKEQGSRVPKTPVSVDAYAELTFDDEDVQDREEEEYRQKVGSLQFAATTTWPDIAFACSKLGSGLTVRSDQHWREVNRCLAYLADTCDTALEFGGGPESLELIGYVDADDAGNKQNRTSTGGYVFVYGGATVSCSWPFTVEELLDMLRRAAEDCCGVAIDQGTRQP